MKRSTLQYWIRRCPSCGYCAPQVSQGDGKTAAIVKGEVYRQQLADPAYPELANSFLGQAMIQEDAGNHAEAGWAALHAAWVCDDLKPPMASFCRSKAIQLFQGAMETGETISEETGVAEAVMADLYRRTGEFEKAQMVCLSALFKPLPELITQVLTFQKSLTEKQDEGCHTVGQAVEYAKGFGSPQAHS
ncbi:MAG: hypothetical protein FJZ96_15620 [Chloroflexi bacterium]|nr:hypothetical protein [Chloroflexota bacterium]